MPVSGNGSLDGEYVKGENVISMDDVKGQPCSLYAAGASSEDSGIRLDSGKNFKNGIDEGESEKMR